MNVRIAEKLLLMIAFLSSVLMALKISAGSVLLTLSLGSLSIVYFISAQAFRKSSPEFIKRLAGVNGSNLPITPNLVFGYVFSVSVIGVLYTVNGYPGSGAMLNFGMIGLLIGVAFTYFKQRGKTQEFLQPYFGKILLISLILGAFIVIPNKEIRRFFNHEVGVENVMDEVLVK